MAEGYHNFSAGEDLTDANLEDFCELQGIMRFASAAARDTALSAVKTEGMCAFLKDVNTITIYNGSAWSTAGPLFGAWNTYTPTLTQSGTVTKTGGGTYTRFGRLIIGQVALTVTGSGTTANPVLVSLPVTASAAAASGAGYIQDVSANTSTAGAVALASTTTMGLILTGTGAPLLWGATTALASGDQVIFQFMYEAAADA